jgi:hypothetical protein
MRRLGAIALVGFSLVTSALAEDKKVRITYIPDYSSPELAWRASIAIDGTVSLERSDVAVTTLHPEFRWVRDTAYRKRISERQVATLFESLEALELGELGPEYSANRSWSVPGETAKVIGPSGEVLREVPAETARVVTHGGHYGLWYRDRGRVDTTVYAPFSALDNDPDHPNRGEIRKILTAWYLVLKTTGPIADAKAGEFKPYVEAE